MMNTSLTYYNLQKHNNIGAIMDYAKTHFSPIAVKLVKLFCDYSSSSTLVGINLKTIFTINELRILIECFGDIYNKEYNNGIYYGGILTNLKTIHTEQSRIIYKTSYTLSCLRFIKKIFTNALLDDDIEVLAILLSKVKSDFIGEYNNSILMNEQIIIIKNLLKKNTFF